MKFHITPQQLGNVILENPAYEHPHQDIMKTKNKIICMVLSIKQSTSRKSDTHKPSKIVKKK